MSPTNSLPTKTYVLFIIAHVFFAFAWLLLLICMFLPQVQIRWYLETDYSTLSGYKVSGIIFMLSPYAVLRLVEHFFSGSFFDFIGGITSLPFVILMSNLLFIVSPFVLIKFKKRRLIFIYIYWILNIIYSILFPLALLYGLKEPEGVIGIRLLPNMFLWVGAQLMLTLSASARLLGERIAMHHKIN
jgi:hypothetical protein